MNTQRRVKSVRAPRAEQLRRAKRAQRARQRAAGVVVLQLALPKPLADKFVVAHRSPDFVPELDSWLGQMLVRLADYPQLRDIAWNRTDEFIPAKEAFQLYERNWRFVDPGRLNPAEFALLERLKAEFGNGVING